MYETLAVSLAIARPGRSEVVDRPTPQIVREYAPPVSMRISSSKIYLTIPTIEPTEFVNIDGSVLGQGSDRFEVLPTKVLRGKVRQMGAGPIAVE